MSKEAHNQVEEIEEKFDALFPNKDAEFCGCGEGDFQEHWPKGKQKLLNFIRTEINLARQYAIEEGRRAGLEEAIKVAESKRITNPYLWKSIDTESYNFAIFQLITALKPHLPTRAEEE